MSMYSLKPKTLEESIYATVAYFDIFDYPLTQYELWVFLLYPPYVRNGITIEDVLNACSIVKDIQQEKGFVCLKGRSEIIQMRIDRYLIAERKSQKALRFGKVCALVPGVTMIALCNTLAFSNSREDSDIDFFIVTKKRYLWFARAFCVFISFFFGKRPSQQNMRDSLCLSFFVSEDSLNLSDLSLTPKRNIDDIYLAVWVSRCIPLYNENMSYQNFWKENSWSEHILPNRLEYIPNHMRRIVLAWPLGTLKYLMTMALAPLQSNIERVCETLQRKKFPQNIQRAAIEQSSNVVVTNSMLKFHLCDRRSEFRDALLEKLHSFQ